MKKENNSQNLHVTEYIFIKSEPRGPDNILAEVIKFCWREMNPYLLRLFKMSINNSDMFQDCKNVIWKLVIQQY